ncbi:hypothetical protein ACFVW5_02485 [Streptomyces sp. NPDC058232]|uniref:hypothetical protein n=1 Tax=Streptomyces sp. NPDC058232 TaxID=3346393 RepID=UPI0036EF3CBF
MRELAAGSGGAAAASYLLMMLALLKPRRPRPGAAARGRAARATMDVAHVWWAAALDADLPPGALAGAGYFAKALPDEVWLSLARRSAEHTPAQTCADKVAERAAGHPRSPDALLLAAHLLTRPALGPLYDAEVRRHARALLQAAVALPGAERPAQTEQLRRALVELGVQVLHLALAHQHQEAVAPEGIDGAQELLLRLDPPWRLHPVAVEGAFGLGRLHQTLEQLGLSRVVHLLEDPAADHLPQWQPLLGRRQLPRVLSSARCRLVDEGHCRHDRRA